MTNSPRRRATPKSTPPQPNKLMPTESQIASCFVSYVDKAYPNLSEDLIHIPNEGKRSWAKGKQMKREGLRKGVSDYFFSRPKLTFAFSPSMSGSISTGFTKSVSMGTMVPSGVVYFGLWLEIKTHKGKESPEQKAFGIRQTANGYQYSLCRSVDECIRVFEEYIKS